MGTARLGSGAVPAAASQQPLPGQALCGLPAYCTHCCRAWAENFRMRRAAAFCHLSYSMQACALCAADKARRERLGALSCVLLPVHSSCQEAGPGSNQARSHLVKVVLFVRSLV